MSSPTATLEIAPPAIGRRLWLFSPTADLLAFGGSAVVSLLLLAYGVQAGLIHEDTPDWTWISAVLLVDVAHVWSTAFIVYFDPKELKRRWRLYTLVPLLGFVAGLALYLQGEMTFWRVLAYLAVFHFVRQQWGWVAMYRGRLGERDLWGLWLDRAAIYLATLYPLIHWHAHLPRQFQWFRQGDFAGARWPLLDVPELFALLERVTAPLYWSVLIVYAGRSLWRWRTQGVVNPGKDLVVLTTALCWYVGIVAFNSDYAFTVTNVIIHGVPYFVLVFWYWRLRREQAGKSDGGTWSLALIFLATLWLLAYVEELFWHRGLWHDRLWLFGGGWDLTLSLGGRAHDLRPALVALLALPQVTHYVLDGFLWRRKSNPDLALLSR